MLRRLRELTEDPPLRTRVTWRDPIRARTLISKDIGLVARAFGTLFTLGGLAGLALLAFGDRAPEEPTWLGLVVSLLGISLGAICFIGYRRLPTWFFQLLVLLATGLIAIATTIGEGGVAGVYALFYVWLVVLVSLFFALRMAVFQIAVMVIAYAAVLYSRDIPYASNYVITTMFVLGTSGVVIAMLRGRIEAAAVESASEANTDVVTGIPNRRGFNQRFDLEIARTGRTDSALSLVICDLDHFKRVNDLLGHDRGDAALCDAAAAIAEAVRGVDAVGRLGGEEFGVVLPGADTEEAFEIADRIRDGVRRAFADHPIEVTACCGTATLGSDGAGRQELLRSADQAMYEAKRRGRDRTVAHSEVDYGRVASSTK
jgi:diguanylate cyclase (GGDEF)-like protein